MPQTNPDVQRFNLLRRFSDARRSEYSRFPLSLSPTGSPLPQMRHWRPAARIRPGYKSPLVPGGQNSAGPSGNAVWCALACLTDGACRPELGQVKWQRCMVRVCPSC